MLKRILLCLLLLLPFVSAAAEVFSGPPPAEWANKNVLEWITFDVDEGDAMLLRCGGETLMVDGGASAFADALKSALIACDITHINTALITHSHNDHADGVIALLDDGLPVDVLLHGYSLEGIAQSRRLSRAVNIARRSGTSVRRVMHGDMFFLGGARWEVLQCEQFRNANARSLVLRIAFGHSSLLLCADITGQVQHWLLQTHPDKLEADLLKLPHHAVTPVVPSFLNAVSAKGYVVTACRKSLQPGSIAQLEAQKSMALFSGDGPVKAVTDGVDWYVWQETKKGE